MGDAFIVLKADLAQDAWKWNSNLSPAKGVLVVIVCLVTAVH